MGEIDTKPIESVQTAISLFGEKNDWRKYRPTSRDLLLEKEKELDSLQKDLANYKVQVEAKDTAYMQALLKLEHHQKIAAELSTLLRTSEIETDKYIVECREAGTRIDDLESEMKEMANRLLESEKLREYLSHVLSELKATQGELLGMETELAATRESKLEAMIQAELLETAAHMEKEKTEELLKHISELNEAILLSKWTALEAEKEKCEVLSEKDAAIQSATETAILAQEQLEDMRKQMEIMQELENQLLSQYILIEVLQSELKQSHELHTSSVEAASDAANELNELKADLELKEKTNSVQSIYIESLDMELDHLKIELKNAKKEIDLLNCDIEKLTSELEKVKNEMNETREKEKEAQVEVALLKAELHKGRSKIAAAEAAEARANSIKSGLYLAVQKLAVEADEAKKENRRLKEVEDKTEEETGNYVLVNSPYEIEVSKTDAEEKSGDITISMEEYKSLIKKAEKADQIPTSENKYEMEILKKKLDTAMVKIVEFRTRAEQAVTRAELAEKAQMELEHQIRKWREQRQKRRAALAALREETVPQEETTPQECVPVKYNTFRATTYQTLGKALNMEL